MNFQLILCHKSRKNASSYCWQSGLIIGLKLSPR
nr:MAG TPA_asm: hypothetical protein [Bacteriophage sp.]